jgi:hypothetical protein
VWITEILVGAPVPEATTLALMSTASPGLLFLSVGDVNGSRSGSRIWRDTKRLETIGTTNPKTPYVQSSIKVLSGLSVCD